jgi:hypothetical protein
MDIIKPVTPKFEQETHTIKSEDDKRVEKSNYWLKRIGRDLEGPGLEYLGSMSVHLYRHKVSDHTYTTIRQVLVENVEEGLADYGFKELKKTAMGKYGRKEPAKRK